MADALTAARLLHLEAEPDLVVLMELLGLCRDDQPTVPPPRRRPTPDYPEPPTQVGQRTQDETGVPATIAPTGIRTVAEPLPPEPVAPIDYSTADPLDPGPPGSGSVAYEPIVPLHQLPAAITMIIRRPRRSIEVDIEAAVELVAEQRPLEQLPRLVEHTLDRGVTIVADVGPEMLPYLEDVAHLADATQRVAGVPETRIVWVEDSDEVPVLDPDRPVMIISTLGVARAPASPPGLAARWREWARAMSEVEADLIALVPHRRRRWSEDAATVRFVAWDDLAEVGRGRS